ncbi:MAG: alpha/beta hydrolase fold protein [Verrucomicrobiales bacterium]|nr:alpha/beta hydrolase fold protein [Verrucomicrobiales bacterium]
MPILQTPDTPLYYEIAGDGSPVLFIQGVGVVGEGWRPQVDTLKEEFRTMIFDNRGIGKSQPCPVRLTIEDMARDALALMDAADWERAHVVGHSMGGVIAQQLALDCPSRVRSLSLLCTFAEGREAARLTPWTLWMTLRARLGTRQMRRRAFVEMLASPAELESLDKDACAAMLTPLLGRDPADQPPIVMRQLMALRRHNAFPSLGKLAGIPALVISASQDRIARVAFGKRLATAIPGAVIEEWEGAAHGVPILQAAAVNERLRRFFRQVED